MYVNNNRGISTRKTMSIWRIADYVKQRFQIGDRVSFVERKRDEEERTITEFRRRGTIVFMNYSYAAIKVQRNRHTIIHCILHQDTYYHEAMRKE